MSALQLAKRLAPYFFWFSVLGTFVAIQGLIFSYRVPELAASVPYFLVGTIGFAVGMVANYLLESK